MKETDIAGGCDSDDSKDESAGEERVRHNVDDSPESDGCRGRKRNGDASDFETKWMKRSEADLGRDWKRARWS